MKKLLSREEIAQEIGVTPQTIWNLGRAGKIPFYKIKGTLRYDLQEVLNYCSRPARREKPKFQAAPKKEQALPIVMGKLTGREQDIFNRLFSSFDKNNVRKVAKMISASREDQRKRYVEIFELLLGYGGHDKETNYENNMEAYMRKLSSR